MADIPAKNELRVELRRTFRTSAERLFDAWTDDDLVAQWMCHDGADAKVKLIKHDVRPGGSLRFEVKRTAPMEVYLVFVTFDALEPPGALSFKWAWERTLPPNPWLTSEGESDVRVTFAARGEETELHLDHGPFTSKERRDLEGKGWTSALDALARVNLAEP